QFYLDILRSFKGEAVEEIADFIKERFTTNTVGSALAYRLMVELYPSFSSSEKFCELIRNEEMIFKLVTVAPLGRLIPAHLHELMIRSKQLGIHGDFEFFVECLRKEQNREKAHWVLSFVFSSQIVSERDIIAIFAHFPNIHMPIALRLSDRLNTS